MSGGTRNYNPGVGFDARNSDAFITEDTLYYAVVVIITIDHYFSFSCSTPNRKAIDLPFASSPSRTTLLAKCHA